MRYRKLFIIFTIMTFILYGCGVSSLPTNREYNQLDKKTSIGEYNIAEIKLSLVEFISIIYAPNSQESIDSSFKKIEKYCTEEFISSLKRDINSYKEGQEQYININYCLYGSGKNQFDGMDRVGINFDISSNIYEKANITLEFIVNPNNKIFKYDVFYRNA